MVVRRLMCFKLSEHFGNFQSGCGSRIGPFSRQENELCCCVFSSQHSEVVITVFARGHICGFGGVEWCYREVVNTLETCFFVLFSVVAGSLFGLKLEPVADFSGHFGSHSFPCSWFWILLPVKL